MTEADKSKIVTLEGLDSFREEMSAIALMSAVATTYANLVTMRTGSKLKAGQWYRITDYVTTTAAALTQSAGHAFDILVRADGVNILNENAFAALHSGDTYFANSKINAWELKYCLDNDTNRFAWANTSAGKGVIWWMKDEYGNECPYDFKNIMFARYQITACAKVPGLVNTYNGFADLQSTNTKYPSGATIANTAVYRYTFDYLSGTTSKDLTIYQQTQTNVVCHGNIIRPWYVANQKKMQLNNITIGGVTFAECYGNEFGENCYNNAIAHNCYGNKFGTNVYCNTIGNGFGSNTIGNYFYYNTIGNSFWYNSIGNEYRYNSIGNYFQDNTIGNYFYYNTIGNSFFRNTIGNGFDSNTIGNGFDSNTIGNYFQDNTIGNDIYNNTIGNSFYGNTIGNYFRSNTIGNFCRRNTFGDCVQINSIIDNAMFLTFGVGLYNDSDYGILGGGDYDSNDDDYTWYSEATWYNNTENSVTINVEYKFYDGDKNLVDSGTEVVTIDSGDSYDVRFETTQSDDNFGYVTVLAKWTENGEERMASGIYEY